MGFRETVKYEITFGLIDGEQVNLSYDEYYYKRAWMRYAKEYFNETGIYVSSIAYSNAHALYHEDWGCPRHGEQSIVFHCTMNPEFVKDPEKYEEGILYISKKIKEKFNQNTVNITKLKADVEYITNKGEKENE